jgi:DNA-binding beta-propeller fold protein YncE
MNKQHAMNKQPAILLALGLLLTATLALYVQAQDNSPLKLVQRIPMPNVHGRHDHLGVDIKGKRLFATANGENQNTVEVIDLKAGKQVFSIAGQSNPHGPFYSADFKKLFVTNSNDGTCKIFRGDNFKLIDSVLVGKGADNVGYDPTTKYLYVGVGDANSGALVIIDTHTNKHIGDIKTDSRPGAPVLEKSGPRIFAKLNATNKLAVIDRNKREVITTWPVTATKTNDALALDQSHHRLFDGTRTPPMLVVLDTDSGKEITRIEDSVSHIDDLWYDAAHKRIYATGDDFMAVYDQKDADHYSLMMKIPTAPHAPTSLWVPEFNRLYVSAPQNGDREAEILVYEPQR